MEKVRSGQSFLYREGGLNSTVLDVRLKDTVRGDYLQRALGLALQRFPYMANKLVEIDGDFYFEPCPLALNVNCTEKFRSLGSAETGYHLIDVTYTAKAIRVAFHHALCDGRGIKPFLETLVYYYCCLRYHKKLAATGVRLAGEPLLPGETQEPVSGPCLPLAEDNLPQISKSGYALPENAENLPQYYRYEINIKQTDFIGYMKAQGATPASLLALLVSAGIYQAHPEARQPIVCSMAVDYRREIGLENTHKNCVGSLYLPYSAEIRGLPLAEQANIYRTLMKEQKAPEAVKRMVNTQIGLCEKLDQLPTLQEKQRALAFFNDLCIDTYVISYLGQMQFGGAAGYVETVHLYNSGVKGLRINMIASADYFTVDMLQNFASEALLAGFLQQLDQAGLGYTVAGPIAFATAKDQAFVTAGQQPERYYKKVI